VSVIFFSGVVRGVSVVFFSSRVVCFVSVHNNCLASYFQLQSSISIESINSIALFANRK
jgi:hypothetical protein